MEPHLISVKSVFPNTLTNKPAEPNWLNPSNESAFVWIATKALPSNFSFPATVSAKIFLGFATDLRHLDTYILVCDFSYVSDCTQSQFPWILFYWTINKCFWVSHIHELLTKWLLAKNEGFLHGMLPYNEHVSYLLKPFLWNRRLWSLIKK